VRRYRVRRYSEEQDRGRQRKRERDRQVGETRAAALYPRSTRPSLPPPPARRYSMCVCVCVCVCVVCVYSVCVRESVCVRVCELLLSDTHQMFNGDGTVTERHVHLNVRPRNASFSATFSGQRAACSLVVPFFLLEADEKEPPVVCAWERAGTRATRLAVSPEQTLGDWRIPRPACTRDSGASGFCARRDAFARECASGVRVGDRGRRGRSTRPSPTRHHRPRRRGAGRMQRRPPALHRRTAWAPSRQTLAFASACESGSDFVVSSV
jgi:hypothetical protein